MNKNFTFEEFVKSSNHPTLQAKELPINVAENLFNLWYYILQPLRDAYGKPITVTSGYRPEKLNKAVSGAKSSQHLTGQAVDIKGSLSPVSPEGKKPLDIYEENAILFKLIQDLNLPFDQLICEKTVYRPSLQGGDGGRLPSWIHVSYGPRHRKQVLYYD